MEALTAVAVAALTVYDMVKAVDKAMIIGDIRLAEKRGGKSGEYIARARRSERMEPDIRTHRRSAVPRDGTVPERDGRRQRERRRPFGASPARNSSRACATSRSGSQRSGWRPASASRSSPRAGPSGFRSISRSWPRGAVPVPVYPTLAGRPGPLHPAGLRRRNCRRLHAAPAREDPGRSVISCRRFRRSS